MREVAVAVLDVHEVESGLRRQRAGRDEALHQRLDLLIGRQRMVRRNAEAAVEHRMARRDPRLGAPAGRRPAEPSGVRELQADQQIVAGAVALPVLVDQRAAQRRQAVDSVFAHAELVGVGAPGVLDRHRLASPDQLGAGAAERPPAPLDQRRGPAVGGAVPPFHRLHAEAVSHGSAVRQRQRLGQRRGGIAGGERELLGYAEPVEVFGKPLGRFQRGDAGIGAGHPVTLSGVGGAPQPAAPSHSGRRLAPRRCVRHPSCRRAVT